MRYNIKATSYPTNLIIDVIRFLERSKSRISRSCTSVENLYDIIKIYRTDGLEFLIKSLSDREREIINLRYVNKHSTKKICERSGCSTEYLSQELYRLYAKLSYPARFKYIQHDISLHNDIKLSMDKTELDRIYYDDFIEVLGLPTRSQNALRRYGICTIRELEIKISKRNPYRAWYDDIPNVGYKAAKEVERIVKSKNISN